MREFIHEHTYRYRVNGALIDIHRMAHEEGIGVHMLEEALSSNITPQRYGSLDEARRAYDDNRVLPGTDEARAALQAIALFYTTNDAAAATVVHEDDFGWNRGESQPAAAKSFWARR